MTSSDGSQVEPGRAASQRRRTFGGLLAHRSFRLLWLGETVSEVGNAMAIVVVPLLAVLVLRATTFEVSLLTAAAYLPWLLFALPVGAVVDRLPGRPVMIGCDLISAVLFLSVPCAAWLGVLSYVQLAVVELLVGTANVAFRTAYQVNLTTLLTPDQLAEGNAKLQGSRSAAELAGPALAGMTARAVGAAAALLVDVGSFLVSAFCLTRIPASPARSAPRPRARLRTEIAEGIRLVAGDGYLSRMTLSSATANFALFGYLALVVVFLVRVVDAGAALVGLLMAVPGLGAVLGTVLARRAAARFGSANALLLGALPAQWFGLLVPLAALGPRLAYFVVGVLVSALGVGLCNVIEVTFWQVYSPPGMVGRVSATARFLLAGTAPMGALAGGALGSWVGVRSALWFMLGINALSGVALLSREFLDHRDLPTQPKGSEAAPAATAA